jgi:hypothetical protein
MKIEKAFNIISQRATEKSQRLTESKMRKQKELCVTP